MKIGLDIKLSILACAAVVFSGSSVAGERWFPGFETDQQTLMAQRRVEELYVAGDHKRALMIYQHELAPIGDKYAQYMVGYMHLQGQGVPANRARAFAWYRISAERRDAAIVEARDRLLDELSYDEIVESNAEYVRLWREIGDNQLLLKLVRSDMEVLKARTGSRIPRSNSSPLTIVQMRDGESGSQEFYDRVQKRMDERIAFLQSNVEIVDAELSDEVAVKAALEEEIEAEMAALEIR